MNEVTNWLPYLNSGGVLGLLVVIIYGGSKGWWYYGHQYKAKEREAESWKQLALGSIETIKHTLDVIEPAIQRLSERG